MSSTDPLYLGPVKRSVTIAGHQTSISLEPAFWAALEQAASASGLPLNALVARIDVERIAAAEPPNLASAIRLWLFARARAGSVSGQDAPPGDAPAR
ncbi:ribbon-helix-helix domain-containing protein [Sphingomonas colocasiae]|uniref:Ribbon-helix-helix domain-containing protein n=1 Tax=Sphingomonas colocasiae TaxID=1848973 RepID=A0ABS7PS24_9SPHN|nr:ribbon-helix-helix domain-containing protein [Sphingomonas colocasiae]MBY8823774.1 ribbon-helix-helix domain-containing protein [Sphingomonas colocasiae]